MKHLYLLLIFLIFSAAHGQGTQGSGDIPGFKLYPNPVTNGKVIINTHRNAPKQILIYDVLGTLVMETSLSGKELDLANLDAGVYVLRVIEDDNIATRKLIVK